MHFFVAHESPVHTDGKACARGHVKHVTHAQQGLSPHLVEDGAAVNFAGHLKRDAGGDVGLDQARDHVHAGALGGQNQMDAGSAGFLGQARNQLFDLFAHHHHQIGQLVDHHHDVRQALERLGIVGREAKGVVDELLAGGGVINLDVVAGQIAHTHFAHEFVAFFHFGHTPIQTVSGLTHVGHHRGNQMRNAFVDRHFQHLGVDHQQTHIARLGLVQQRQNHGVDAHRLARAGGTGHQHMGHFGQIGHHRVANDVFAQAHGQHGFGFVVDLRAEDFTQLDRLALGIGQLQSHVVFTGDGLDHANRHQAERARQVLGQIHHLRAFDAGGGLDFVAGDHRPWSCHHHPHIHPEVLELLFDQTAGHLQRFGRDRLLAHRQAVQQMHLRQLAVGQLGEQRFLPFFGYPVAAWHIDHGRLDHDGLGRCQRQRQRLQIQLAFGRQMGQGGVPFRFNGVAGHGLLSLAQGLLAQGQIFLNLSLFVA